MKVKNGSYLKSLTALLRSNIKNYLDPYEKCEPWFETVSSVTYIWTRRPQWRRRHKNRKKSKPPRFPITSINSRINENELLDTFKIIERPISRSSASPYETCSSRQIVPESELTGNYNLQQPELLNLALNQRDQEYNSSVSVSESLSDSRLRNKSGETQMIRLIRSQKRLGNSRNSANGQASVETFSNSLEVNRSIRLSFERELQSDCSIPKRHVTFSNYVSENSVSYTSKSHKSPTIMNDNEACESSDQWQESYLRFTDDEDSLDSDLSRFFSSIIFDVSKSSISLTSSKNSDEVKKWENMPKKECSENIFYVNSLYSKKSSCDLLAVKKICSVENYQEFEKLTSNTCYVDKKQLEITKLFIKNDTSLLNDEILPENEIKDINKDLWDIDCINIELKDITSNEKEFSIESASNFDTEPIYSSSYKNHISTDTSDLNHSIEINRISSLPPIVELSKNDSDDVSLNFSKLIDFLQPPRHKMDEIIVKELSTVGIENFINCEEKYTNEDMNNMEISNANENWKKNMAKVDLLRIDAETYGECESVFIEMKHLDDSFGEENILNESSLMEIPKFSPNPCESFIVNLPKVAKKFPPITSTGSNFRNGHAKCTGADKCCLICGRSQTDNPRYLRPVCRVKGVNPTPRLENDPWINVMKKVIKHDHGKELISQEKSSKNEDESHQDFLTSSKDENFDDDETLIKTILLIPENESENVKKEEEECFSVIITETENSLPSNSTENSTIFSSRDESTSCPPEADLVSSGSFELATSSRIQSTGKSYYTRESMRSVDCTKNRLLCVISESDSLMRLPQFLPKKPPDWFGRQVPRRKWSRR